MLRTIEATIDADGNVRLQELYGSITGHGPW